MRYARLRHPYPAPRRNVKLPYSYARLLRYSRVLSIIGLLVALPIFITTLRFILHSKLPHHDHDHNISLQRFINNITIPEYLQRQASRKQSPVPPEESVSLIAACMNRRESLGLALPSWQEIQQINEIILVDWSSQGTYDIPSAPNVTNTVSLIRVKNAEAWVLSRAYNLASKFVAGKYILKVDCDTHLDASFFTQHPLPPQGTYYTTAHGTQRDNNEQSLRGVWFGHTADFRSVGGYDERIVAYGYEDTDLYNRFDAFLTPLPLHLDYVRHNVGGDIVWQREFISSKRVSTRMNQAFLANVPPWRDVLTSGNASQYEYSLDSDTNILYAFIMNRPRAIDQEIPLRNVIDTKSTVHQRALHDDFNMPWDILSSLDISHLEYLAAYLDNDQPKYIIIAVLEGSDALSNLFNLVSALQAGITTGRPVIAIWRFSFRNETLLSHLVDIDETNERLRLVIQSVTARRHGFSKISRIIPAREWTCDKLSECGTRDKAYSQIIDVEVAGKTFDERDPFPLPIRQHALVRLGDTTKLGDVETRTLAFGCIVFSAMVKRRMLLFDGKVGVIAESNSSSLLGSARERRDRGLCGVVGPRAREVRSALSGGRMCDDDYCSVEDMGMEVANVMAVVNAEQVLPQVAINDSISSAMVADLRTLLRQRGDGNGRQI